MKFLTKAKDWLVAHKPTKRRIIQLYAALLTNAHLKGFSDGDIYKGPTKKACVPGLNCYSCPGAVGACPLGALQDSLSKSGTTVPAYIFGILILFGLMLGRIVCSFLCPFGLIQELLYKIRTPKLRKSRFTRILSYFKYVMLALVIALPVLFVGIPAFCQYVCPAGMLEGAVPILSAGPVENFSMLRHLFTWKFCVMVVVLVASVFIYRFFCRFICPLGAIYSLFNRISLLGVRLDKNKCIDCGLCIQGCKMDVKRVGDHECIMCGECISVCPVQAISWKGSQIFVHPTSPLAQPAVGEPEKVDLLQLAQSNSQQVVLSQPAQTESATVEEEGATVTEIAETAEQPQKSSKIKAIKAAFKRPRFVVEFTAWVVALCVLIAALVCFNLPEKSLEKLPELTFTTYESVAQEGGQEYTLSTEDSKVRVISFWRTDLEDSYALFDDYVQIKQEYADYIDIEFLAVHTLNDGEDTQSFIDERGWNAYDIKFVQDKISTNAYMTFGGDTTVPKPITVVLKEDGSIVATSVGAIDAKELKKNIQLTRKGNTYKKGDRLPSVDLNGYCGKEGLSTINCRGKVTVLNFWYTACNPCKNELPEFNKVYKQYGGEVNMFAVHSADAIPPEGVQSWLDSNADKNGLKWSEYSLTFVQDNELNLFTMLGGRSIYPITIVADADGIITYSCYGECSEEELITAIEEAMNK